ncbi:MAG TPA: hypothetical protein VFZ64_04980 [Nocardioidaceae bacterium]
MRVLKRLGVGLGAAVVTGLAAGLVARLMMRLATMAGGGDTSFSIGGTAGIVLVFVAAALPGAVLAALMARRGRSALLVVGSLLLCLPAAGVAGEDLGHLSGMSTLQWVGVGLSTVGVFAAILAMPWVALRVVALGRTWPAGGA